jgi:transcriptional regulator with XRE-family HTH domain
MTMNEQVAAELPNRLRELREAADESQERVAADLEVSKETVDSWERKNIPTWRLAALADRYAVSIGYLLRHEERDVA